MRSIVRAFLCAVALSVWMLPSARADAVIEERCFPYYHRCESAAHHGCDGRCHFTPGHCAAHPGARSAAPTTSLALVALLLIRRRFG